MARGNALRILRQTTVAVVGLAILANAWLTDARLGRWQETVWVTVYPALATETPRARDYVAALRAEDFEPVRQFLAREAGRYGLGLDEPLRIDLGEPTGLPPALPGDAGPVGAVLWSLRLRWWAWRETADRPGPEPDVRLFVVYHDPAEREALPHSVGLEASRTAIAHVFASPGMRGSNQVVIAHELLHTLGASDKYGPDNRPRFPDGYAEPARRPRYPQRYAEIMGGRIPVSAVRADIPEHLGLALIGPATAAELRWPANPPP